MSNSPLSPLSLIAAVDFSKFRNICFIDSTIISQEFKTTLPSLLNNDTYPVMYEPNTDGKILKLDLLAKFKKIDRVSFLFKGIPTKSTVFSPQPFINNIPFFTTTASPSSETQVFLHDLFTSLHVQNVDFLAGNLLQQKEWKDYFATFRNVVVGASLDNTGKMKYGVEWLMEKTVRDIYFKETTHNLYIPLVMSSIDLGKYKNICFIDSAVRLQSKQSFSDFLSSDTYPVIYEPSTDRDLLKNTLVSQFTHIDRISFVFHGIPDKSTVFAPTLFLNNQPFFTTTLEKDSSLDNQAFLQDLFTSLHVKRVDFLGCNLLQQKEWKDYFATFQNVVVGASLDNTGNVKYGGDWVMENTQENIKSVYFNAGIANFTALLDTYTYTYTDSVNTNITITLGYTVDTLKRTASVISISTSNTDTSVTEPTVLSIVLPEIIPSGSGRNDYNVTVTSIGQGDKNSSIVYDITIPNSVSKVGYNAFQDCTSLKSIILGAGVKVVSYSFRNCTNLTSVTLNDGLTNLNGNVFGNCSSLRELIIPNSVTFMSDNVCFNCTSLTSVVIGNGLSEISEQAFENCTSLTSVVIPDSVTNIKSLVFKDCESLTGIVIPNSVTSMDTTTFEGCARLTYINVGSGNSTFSSVDGVLYDKLQTILQKYPSGKAGTSFLVPASVTNLQYRSFLACNNLTQITFPDSVTSIDRSQIEECTSLTSLIFSSENTSFGVVDGIVYCFTSNSILLIPSPFTATSLVIPDKFGGSLPRNAFQNNISLTSVDLGERLSNVSESCFEGCTNLTTLVCNGPGLSSLNSNSFKSCTSLTSLEFGKNISSIGTNAFNGCTRLTSLVIEYAVSNQITFEYYSFQDCTGLRNVRLHGYSTTFIFYQSFVRCDLSETNFICPKRISFYGDPGWTVTNSYFPAGVSDINVYYNGYPFGNSNLYFIEGTDLTSNESLYTKITTNGITPIFQSRIDMITDLKGKGYTDEYLVAIRLIQLKYTDPSANVFTFDVVSKTSAAIASMSPLNFNGAITIPSSVSVENGPFNATYDVTSIGKSAFSNNIGLTNITIPNSVTYIQDYAFDGCSSLTSCDIPNSVTSAGYGCFSNCTNLTSINIGSGFSNLHANIFSNSNIVNINVSGDNANYTSVNGVVYDKTIKNVVLSYQANLTIPNSVTSLGFQSIYGLKSITFGTGITSIGDYVFYNNQRLESIVIPNSITSIGSNSFAGCSILTSVAFQTTSQLTEIKSYAFGSCTALESFVIPNSVTLMGSNIFESCYNLTSVTTGTGLRSIPYSFLYNISSIKHVDITGTNVTSISDSAFSGCTGLTSVSIPNSVTSIGDYAFANCRSLTSVVIGNSVTSIGSDAFANCRSLTSVVIGNSVTSIGSFAFENCTGLTSVVIPNSVTSILDNTFFSCTALTSVVIGNSVTSTFYTFSSCTALTSVVIGNSVASILDYTFYSCTNLTSIDIPNSVTEIADDAFLDCHLKTIYFYNTVSIPALNNNVADDYYYLSTVTSGKGVGDNWHVFVPVNLDVPFILDVAFLTQKVPTFSPGANPSTPVVISQISTLDLTDSSVVGTTQEQKQQFTTTVMKLLFAANTTQSLLVLPAGSILPGYSASLAKPLYLFNASSTVSNGAKTVLTGDDIMDKFFYILLEAGDAITMQTNTDSVTITKTGSTFRITSKVSVTIANTGDTYKYDGLNIILGSVFGTLERDILCFREGTTFITCLDLQTKEEYDCAVETIQPGMFVKTYKHGYIKVDKMAYRTIQNPDNPERIKNRLYQCSKTVYPELTQDLYMTGCHAILEDDISEEQAERIREVLGHIYYTDDKYRLIAMCDKRAEPYCEKGEFKVWHVCLDHFDEGMNYGVYANGLLVESCCKRNAVWADYEYI